MSVPDLMVIIPARYQSTRFPGKPLVQLVGSGGIKRPLIEWSWRAATASVGVERVIVATDDSRIADEVVRFGGRVEMTPSALRNGTERCAWLVQSLQLTPELVVNFQGDAPLVPASWVRDLVTFARERGSAMATPYVPCTGAMAEMLRATSREGHAGGTCVVTDGDRRAMYFSKFPIPYGDDAPLKMHVGLYAYTPEALANYLALLPTTPELSEGLEQLRFLNAGIAIDMLEMDLTHGMLWELNNPGDVQVIERALQTG